ncbi:hypothetical protein BDK92_3535 [Micromonospora pisi]|uniref:Uncharacterized protein n=1 Tax=Micromonospora pisi TaxID=589240 RepID=A0A495JJK3_9ACTN|nr:hypothetical protein [Micromonospora pisi]RKR89196.1 hypothetical protein BDK92_3535 [Micromonospora pisi]
MYAWIWRRLPFGLVGKLIGSVLLVSASVALLWYLVFPWAEPLLPFDDVQVTQEDGGGDPSGVDSGESGDDSSVGGDPATDDHSVPYDTEENNTPPPSPDR